MTCNSQRKQPFCWFNVYSTPNFSALKSAESQIKHLGWILYFGRYQSSLSKGWTMQHIFHLHMQNVVTWPRKLQRILEMMFDNDCQKKYLKVRIFQSKQKLQVMWITCNEYCKTVVMILWGKNTFILKVEVGAKE